MTATWFEPTTTYFINEHYGMSFHLLTKWLWNRIPLQSLKLQISRLFWTRNSLTFRQLESVYLTYSAYHNTQWKSLKLINFQPRLSLIIYLKKVRFLRSQILSIASMPFFSSEKEKYADFQWYVYSIMPISLQ